MRLLYNQHNCSQSLLPLQEVPDIEVRLLVKALILCSTCECEFRGCDDSLQLLTDEEVSRMKRILLNSNFSEPFTFHGLSYKILFSMIKCLAGDSRNTALFAQEEIPSILAELADRVDSDELKEDIAGLIWTLMQVEGQDDTEDTAETIDNTADSIVTKQEAIGKHYCKSHLFCA